MLSKVVEHSAAAPDRGVPFPAKSARRASRCQRRFADSRQRGRRSRWRAGLPSGSNAVSTASRTPLHFDAVHEFGNQLNVGFAGGALRRVVEEALVIAVGVGHRLI